MPRFCWHRSNSTLGGTFEAAAIPTTTAKKYKGEKRSVSCLASFRHWSPFYARKEHVQVAATAEKSTPSATAPTTSSEVITYSHQPTSSIPQRFISGTDPSPTLTTDNPAGTSGSYSDTALSVLRIVLQTLCAASRSIPIPGINLPFDALLTTFDKITTANQNHQGFHNLADQLRNLDLILLEINQIRDPPVDLLRNLQGELEKLQEDIQRALSSNKVEQFINSTEDASSLTAHDNTIRVIVNTLTLAMSARTGHKIDNVHDGVEGIQAGVARIETALSRSEERVVSPGMIQLYQGAKIDTTQSGVRTGGHIGSGNENVWRQDFRDVDFLTGGGAVGSCNKAIAVA